MMIAGYEKKARGKDVAETVLWPNEIFPRRLKPHSTDWAFGAAEAAPFQNNYFPAASEVRLKAPWKERNWMA
jgi:hypothetical protein